nr:MAG: hypothetical protein DIU62_14770 [Pseudomonadota bacterium]
MVKPEVALKQFDAEAVPVAPGMPAGSGAAGARPAHGPAPADIVTTPAPNPTRFHGTVRLDPARVGRDAARVAEEVLSHLTGLVGADVDVSLEITAHVPGGVPEKVVRVVTENARTLKFEHQGFEKE